MADKAEGGLQPNRESRSVNLKDLLAEQAYGVAGHVPAPELGPDVRVPIRVLNMADRRRFKVLGEPGADRMEAVEELLPLCVADESGARVYEDGDPAVQFIPIALALRIAKAATEFAARGDIEDAKKPSPTPTSAS